MKINRRNNHRSLGPLTRIWFNPLQTLQLLLLVMLSSFLLHSLRFWLFSFQRILKRLIIALDLIRCKLTTILRQHFCQIVVLVDFRNSGEYNVFFRKFLNNTHFTFFHLLTPPLHHLLTFQMPITLLFGAPINTICRGWLLTFFLKFSLLRLLLRWWLCFVCFYWGFFFVFNYVKNWGLHGERLFWEWREFCWEGWLLVERYRRWFRFIFQVHLIPIFNQLLLLLNLPCHKIFTHSAQLLIHLIQLLIHLL